jgi:steroid delta-isomerase-like uncharacterized protein
MEHDSIKQLLERFYAAFVTQNIETLRCAVSTHWQDIPPAPGQAIGPDGIVPVFDMIGTAFTDFRIEIKYLLMEGDRVAVRARMTGVHHGDFMGIPGSDKAFDIALHEFHEIKDGRIARTWHLEDWLALFRHVGAFPPM